MEDWQRKSPVSAHAEISDDRRAYKLVLDDFVATPPIELWGMIVGDCIHNLRSALDNLCYSAARLLRDPPEDPVGIQFPIFDNEATYFKRAARTLGQLPGNAVELLYHFQPFRQDDPEATRRHSLLVLQYLSNQDKHRTPQVALMRLAQHDHQQNLKFESEADAAAWIAESPQIVIEGGPIWAGSTLMTVSCSRPAGIISGSLKLEAFPAIDTPLGLESATATLEVIGMQVLTIFEAFRLTFPNARD